jgi:pyruvate,water dikinase
VRGLVGERRDYFQQWNARRATMPKVLGTVPDEVSDPIMIEVFGINGHSLKVMQRGVDADATELTGIAAAKGTARGTARVLSSSDELHRLSPGDVLVCESTSPNWTPAFGKIAACVCDGGGTLSHAAIVGREYGVPTVTAVAIATVTIRDGDEIEVDGTRGVVTILKRTEQSAGSAGGSADREPSGDQTHR